MTDEKLTVKTMQVIFSGL